jgi:hypothetical protein
VGQRPPRPDALAALAWPRDLELRALAPCAGVAVGDPDGDPDGEADSVGVGVELDFGDTDTPADGEAAVPLGDGAPL